MLLLRLIVLLILLLRIVIVSHRLWQLETIQHAGYRSSLEIGVLWWLLWIGNGLGLLMLHLLELLLLVLTEIWLQWHRC